ncbi:multicopper oxidase family protein [Actinocatenispora rupis]|uniref:Multicopper oxidase with three cupredoxin domains (Includes cell division protein FtsP and spore coat protein CotA) n=1 Tax=Actinocatenispora rupis TaxID=519421 RepID=A0A8J3JE48_9ACTN|nr:multicopper oxidase family protein [Actinocatenispora rupis]GID13158.1 hypothetical protein Aru02nite_40470 [Actinocatenispora rupis]
MVVGLGMLDIFAALVLAGLWLAAGLVAGTLPYAERASRGRIVAVLFWLGVGALAARIALTAGVAGAGWWFVQDRVVLVLPLQIAAVAAVAFVARPRWRALRRPHTRRDAAHPALIAPVQVASFVGLAGVYAALGLTYPVRVGDGFVLAGATVLVGALCWIRHAMRWRRLADTAARPGPALPLRLLRTTGGALLAVVVLCGIGVGSALGTSLPASADMAGGPMDWGGGPVPAGHHGAGHAVSVRDLTGPRPDDGATVRRFTLTARERTVTIGGRRVAALTFNGQVPGPALRAYQGDVVEVTLHNALPHDGVTVHWHGYDVPNAEDGVAGVTQDAVRPGGSFTYRFRADQVGTYWYHSHELASEEVARGLFGTLVVLPRRERPADLDLTLPVHQWGERRAVTLGADTGRTRRAVDPGTTVRLRLVNTDSESHRPRLTGVAYRLVAVDGTDLHGPAPTRDRLPTLPAGGRYDLAFTMPATPVLLDTGDGASLLLGDGPAPTGQRGTPTLDLLRYGTPARTPYGAGSRFDRDFTQVFDSRIGAYDGKPTVVYTVNGRTYPDVPALGVRYGDLVRITLVNRGTESHPIHPHGHHMLVLSRNGAAPQGSPLWMDTVDVGPGEVWQVAVKADNPGIWMDHCHNLHHASAGMMFHLMYADVTSPYRVGDAAGNHPE